MIIHTGSSYDLKLFVDVFLLGKIGAWYKSVTLKENLVFFGTQETELHNTRQMAGHVYNVDQKETV